MRDGGQSSSNALGRALYINKPFVLDRLHLQPGRYEPEIKRNRVSISLDPTSASYSSPRKIPTRVGGVYRILDSSGADLDIGCSKNDARGRVSTRWKHAKEA